ncbi:MAG: PA domain-containing protein, partial [Terracidiphilus sp.]
MILRKALALLFLAAFFPALVSAPSPTQSSPGPAAPGLAGSSAEPRIESEFLAVPSAKLAGRELKALSAVPHVAGTPEDRKTALYVASKFRSAGLEAQIVPFRVLMDWPKQVRVQAWDSSGRQLMTGPTRPSVKGDPYEDDPRIIMPYNASSASGDVTADVLYANYCRPQDFSELANRLIDVRGKIVLCRYGGNFRGVKVYLAQQHGAIGVLISSDPQDDGYFKGDVWPA